MSSARHVWLVPVLAALLQVAGTACSRMGAQGQINASYEAIRKAGLPVTLTELDKWYQQPSGEDDAAPLLEESFARSQLNDADTAALPVVGKEKLPEIGVPLPAATRRKIAQLLAKNESALTLLHQAVARKQCHFPIVMKEGNDVLLPHLAKMKGCVKLLELEAVSNAESINSTGAVQALITSFRLAQLLDQEPFIISQLVRFAIDNTSCSSLERILSTVELNEDQLASLLRLVQDGQSSPGMRRGLIGDRCMSISSWQKPPQERETALRRWLQQTDHASIEESSWEGDFAFFLRGANDAIAASQLPFPQCLESGKKIELRSVQAKQKKYPFSAETLETFSRLFPKHAQHEAHLRCAEAALGVQRYRLAHQNSLPASLDDTVAGTLKAVPADPFDGTPLQYRRESAVRYTISSSSDDPKDKDIEFKVVR